MTFAQGIASCLTYPFNLKFGLVIVGAGVLSAIVSLFPLGNSLGYWFILLVVARLGFDIVDQFAEGHVKPRDVPADFPTGGFGRPLKYWLILVGMGALIDRFARKYGFAAAVGMDIVTSLVLPGMMIVLAMTSSFKSSLNPAQWWRVAHVAPGAFAVLALLSLGIDQLSYWAGELFFPETDDAEEGDLNLAAVGVYMALSVYLRLVNFCLVGLYIHAHRDELGVEDRESRNAAIVAAVSGRPAVRAEIARNLSPADEEKAAYDAMRDDPYDVSRHARYHAALMALPDKAKALAHAKRYLDILAKGGKTAEALALFKRCAAIDPAFKTEQPEEVLPLARAARALKDPHTAVAIVRGFDKANTGHPDIPAVYLFSAQLLAEDLANPDMARKILQHMLTRYPGHSLAGDARAYLQSMPAPA